ncbi:MAG: hybrid sensor histidine kinase/response regulator [Phycisphaerae bacterium]|nr:hybrid sensor histidine kinase/response regulator [Phycisphaerae bacterium]
MSTLAGEEAPIIVIDDDEAMRRACQAALRRTGYQVETYADGPSGLKRIEELGAGLLVVDLKMPGMGGLEVIERVKQISPDIVAIVITGFATVSTAVEAMKAGAYDFIPKPFTAEELRVIISRGMERHRLAMEAKRLRKEKEAQARKFITFVSHQLQSPLGAVQQYLDVLVHKSGGNIPAEYRQWIERSSVKIRNMLQIISDWLTISKVEGGQLVTEREPLRWQDLADEVLENCAAAADENQVDVHNELPADLPVVIGDSTALQMLLSNLVVNGVKYNHPGGEVRLSAEADQETVSLLVSDTGVGIDSRDVERVFEEFFRATDERHAGKSGTGMGLAICKKIAEELGGRITLSSIPGQGSTFTVILPRTPEHPSATAAIQSAPRP